MNDINYDELTSEEKLRLKLFCEGVIANVKLLESVDNDRIESWDGEKKTIYPSLDAAADIMADGDPERKVMAKFRIRKTILEQTNKNVFKRT